jgi:hypothetical protein
VTVIFTLLIAMLIPFVYALAVPLNGMLGGVTFAAKILGGSSFAVVPMQAVGWGIPFYYILLFVIGGFVFLTKRQFACTVVTFVILTVGAAFLSMISPVSNNQVTVLDGSNGSFVVQNDEGDNMVFCNFEEYYDVWRVADYCNQYNLKAIDLFVTDYEGLYPPFVASLNSYGIKINTIYILGRADILSEKYGELKQIAITEKLDYGAHAAFFSFETYGETGNLFAVNISLDGRNVLYIVTPNLNNALLSTKRFRNADIVLTANNFESVNALYKNMRIATFSPYAEKGIYCPNKTGNFTLRLKNDSIVTVY